MLLAGVMLCRDAYLPRSKIMQSDSSLILVLTGKTGEQNQLMPTAMAATPAQEETSDFLQGFATFEAFKSHVYALGVETGANFQDLTDISGNSTSYRTISLTIQSSIDGLQSPDNTQAILRVRRFELDDFPADQDSRTYENFVDDAAVLELAATCGLQVPKMIAYDTTSDNALGLPYSLQLRLPGVHLSSVLEAIPMSSMADIASELAEMLVRLRGVRFPAFGLPCQDKNAHLQGRLQLDLSGRSGEERKVTLCGFPKESGGLGSHNRKSPTLPVTSSLYALLKAAIDNKFLPSRQKNIGGDEGTDTLAHEKLGSMLDQMKAMGWFETEETSTTESVLHHLDLECNRIFVEQRDDSSWHITGILGWENSGACVSSVLTQTPLNWLWDRIDMDKLPQEVLNCFGRDNEYMPLACYEDLNSDHLTEDGLKIKELFENILIKGIYEPQYGEKAAEIYQDHAYGRGRWIRRIWRFAFEGIALSGYKWRLARLRKDWAAFTHAELDSDLHETDEDNSGPQDTTGSTIACGHEPFETFRHRVSALSSELGATFEDIEHMRGGSYNRIVSVTLRNPPKGALWVDGTKAIIRIPRVWDGDLSKIPPALHGSTCKCDAHPERHESIDDAHSDRSSVSSRMSLSKEGPRWEIRDEALLYNLVEDAGIPAPRILAFDLTRDNALGLPFSIQTRLPGIGLIEALKTMSVQEQLWLADELAEIFARLETIQFDSAGRLLSDEDEDTATALPLRSSSRADIEDEPSVYGFRKGTGHLANRKRDAKAESTTLSSLYKLLFFTLHERIDDELQKQHPQGPSQQQVRQYFKLQDILQDMDRIGWFSEADKTDANSVLNHWDMEPRNMLVERTCEGDSSRWKITGVIDWDSARALPPVLTRKPPLWLWDVSEDEDLPDDVAKYWDGDYDWMPLEWYQKENKTNLTADGMRVKQRFEDALVEKLYKEYGANAHAKYLDDAYGRGRWLRRIWRFASEGFHFYPTHWNRFQQLEREWTEYKKFNGIECDPPEFAEDMGAYSSSVWPNRAREGGSSEFKGILHDVATGRDQSKG